MKRGVKILLSVSEKVLLGKYFYKQGVNFLSDSEYDAALSTLSKYHPLRYINWEDVSYEDVEDITVREKITVKNSNFKVYKEKFQDINKNYSNKELFDTVKFLSSNIENEEYQSKLTKILLQAFPASNSMQMTSSYDEVKEKYLKQIIDLAEVHNSEKIPTIDMYQSYKMDGWNISVYYVSGINDGKCILAHTRGKNTSDVTICTKLMRYLTPDLNEVLKLRQEQLKQPTIFKINGELVLSREGLNMLRENYPNKNFSNVRNSISCFVHESIDIDKYYNLVKYHTFYMYDYVLKGTPFELVSDMYNWLSSIGFNVPVSKIVSIVNKGEIYTNLCREIDKSYEEFEAYYKNNLSFIFECDGLVLQPNRLSWNDQMQQIMQGNFNDGLLAIKARYWAEKIYKAKVTRIEYTRARVSRSVMAIVEPVTTVLGQKVRRVPLINLQRACIENDVRVGDIIEFLYHSNQLPFFIRNLSNLKRNKQIIKEIDIEEVRNREVGDSI